MPTINIPHGQGRDGWIDVYINGVQYHHKVGVDIEVTQAEMEVLMHAGIVYSSLASGDFTNIATNNAADGVYTLNAETVAITDIIDLSNPNTAFDPVADIDAGGIKAHDNGGGSYSGRVLEMKDPLLATLLGGFTLLIEVLTGAADPDGSITVVPHDVDFNLNTFAEIRLASTDLYALDGTEYFDNAYALLPSQVNKIALTMTAARMAVSINGDVVHAIESGCLTGVDNILLSTGGGADGRLRSFAFYEVVDDADLPTLSAL